MAVGGHRPGNRSGDLAHRATAHRRRPVAEQTRADADCGPIATLHAPGERGGQTQAVSSALYVGQAICERLGTSKVVVVALDGMSAAGKSTLAEALRVRLDAALVHADDFYRDLPEEERRRLSPAEGVMFYFDWERMRDEAIQRLAQGKSASFRCFDWADGEGLQTEPISVEPRPIVIVEGVYTGRPELRPLVDLAVLIETTSDERKRRRRSRHDPSEWEARWDAAERYYFSTVCPPESFDLVVRGDE